jgi:hypothetical protein
MHSSSLPSCYMFCPSHPPWLDYSKYTLRRVQVMKLSHKPSLIFQNKESRLKIRFSFSYSTFKSQTGSGVHSTSYKMGIGGSFPGVKRQEREADHSPRTSAEVKKTWVYTSTPPYVFMA